MSAISAKFATMNYPFIENNITIEHGEIEETERGFKIISKIKIGLFSKKYWFEWSRDYLPPILKDLNAEMKRRTEFYIWKDINEKFELLF